MGKCSPCLIPLVGKIIPHGSPFTKTEYEIVFTQLITRFIHLSLKPIFLIIAFKKNHSTQSYALLISNFSVIYP